MSNPDNAKAALTVEYKAKPIYLAFLPKAHKRWGGKVGRLFQAVVEAETIHALKPSMGLQVAGSTLEKLADRQGV